MPRWLVMSEREVPPSDRAGYLQALAVRRENAATASAHFWVFEDAKTPGRFLEFVEAGSEGVLARAIEAVADRTSSPEMKVMWREVP